MKFLAQERGENMSEKEKKITKKLKEALPTMSEFDKGYLTRMVEESSAKKEDTENKNGIQD